MSSRLPAAKKFFHFSAYATVKILRLMGGGAFGGMLGVFLPKIWANQLRMNFLSRADSSTFHIM